MSLRIDIPVQSYAPNSTVTGTVTLIGTGDIDVSYISIDFSGQCKSKIVVSRGNNGSSTYRGRVYLFEYTQKLFTGPHTLHSNEHSWPFSFRFPATCGNRRGDRFQPVRHQLHSGYFHNDVSQPLPSTYTLAERGFQARKSGYVSYQLEAKLYKHNSGPFSAPQNSTVKKLLYFRPRDETHPNPHMCTFQEPFVCKSMHLLPEYGTRNLTLKERLLSLVSEKPSASFKLTLDMTTVGVCGQALRLYLSAEHDIGNSTSPDLPTLLLKGVKVQLQACGAVRCVNDGFSSLFGEGDREECWEEEITVSALEIKEHPLPISERLDLGTIMNLTLGKDSGFSRLDPSFSTFNLELHYRLRVKVAFECGRKGFKADFVSHTFKLLAGEWIGEVLHNTASSQATVHEAPAYDDAGPSEELPPYARNPELWTPSSGKVPPTSITEE